MENKDLCWFAGWMEGEGSFCPTPPSLRNSPQIVGASTDKDVIERIATLLGVACMTEKPRKDGDPKWKTVYRFCLRGRKAIELMKTLQPLMSIRRRAQIDKALQSVKDSRFYTDACKVIKP